MALTTYIDLEAGDAITEVGRLAASLVSGNAALTNLSSTFSRFNADGHQIETVISGLTSCNQQLNLSFRQTAAGAEFAGATLSSTGRLARQAAKDTLDALNTANRATARTQIERHLAPGLAKLGPDQTASVQEKINQIVAAAGRGAEGFRAYQAAVAAFSSGSTAGLSEAGQRILAIMNRIQNTITKATDKAKADADRIARLASSSATGQKVGAAFLRAKGAQIDALDPAAQERVRNQIAKLQQLFDKGLTTAGYLKAVHALRDGTVAGLTKMEEETRHRLARINAELEKKPTGGGFAESIEKLFHTAALSAVFASGIEQTISSFHNALNAAADFQKQIALLQTISQDAGVSFDQWSKGIREVSNELGKPAAEVAAAGYDLLSNQVTKGIDTLEELRKVGKFAVVTNSTLQESADLVSSAIHSFGLNVQDTDEILKKLFTTVDIGRVTVSGLKDSFGRAALPAKALGVSFDELNASIATISQTGIGEQQTLTLVTNVFHKLINPTKELQALYDKLGVSTGDVFVKTYGFTGVLEILQRETGGSVAELSKLFNEIRGEQGITNLIERFNTYKETLSQFKNASSSLEGAQKIFDKLPGQKFKEEMEKVNNSITKFREIFVDAFGYITEHIFSLGDNFGAIIYASSAVGVAISAAFAITAITTFKASIASTVLGMNALIIAGEAFALALPFAGAVAAAVVLGSLIGKLDADFHNLSVQALEDAKKAADEKAKINKNFYEERIRQEQDALEKQRQLIFQGLAEIKAGYTEVAAAQDQTLKSADENVKNSAELLISSIKKSVEDLTKQEKAALDSIKKGKDEQQKSKDAFFGGKFDRDLEKNRRRASQSGIDSAPGERDLYDKQVRLLRKQAFTTPKDPSDPGKQLQEQIQLLTKAGDLRRAQALITVTDENGIQQALYNEREIEDSILKIERQKSALIRQNAELSKKVAAERAAERDKEEARLKEIAQAAKKLYSFDYTKEKGTPEEKVARLQSRQDDLNKLLEAPGQRLTGDDVEQRYRNQALDRERLRKSEEEQRRAVGDRSRTQVGIDETEERRLAADKGLSKSAVADRTREAEAANAAAEETRKVNDERFKNFGRGRNLSGLDTLIHNFTGKAYSKEIFDKGQEAYTARDKGDYTGSNTKLAEALEIARQRDELQNKIRDAETGELKTVEEMLKYLIQINTQEKVAIESAQLYNNRLEANSAINKGFVESQLKYIETVANTVSATNQFTASLATSSTALTTETQNQATATAALKGNLAEAAALMRDLAKASREVVLPKLPQVDTTPVGTNPSAPLTKNAGGIIYRADGGSMMDFLGGRYAKGSDRIPVMASAGESMINARATARFMPQIMAMNAGFNPSFGGKGDGGNQYSFGDMHIHVKSGDSPQLTAREIVGGIKRQMRRGTVNF